MVIIGFMLSMLLVLDEPVPAVPPPVVAPIRPAPPATPSAPPNQARPNGVKSLVSLFSTDDYPVEAISLGEEGTAQVRLTITTDGSVGQCEVISSSGSQILDRATCDILQRRARLKPALDHHGNPTIDYYTQNVRWELPKQPLRATLDRGIISYNEDGNASACRYESDDKETDQPTCAQLDELVRTLWKFSTVKGRLAGRTLVLEHRLQPDIDSAIPRPADTASTLHWFQSAQYELTVTGTIMRCTINESESRSNGPDLCEMPLDGPFERADQPGRRFFQASVALISLPPR